MRHGEEYAVKLREAFCEGVLNAVEDYHRGHEIPHLMESTDWVGRDAPDALKIEMYSMYDWGYCFAFGLLVSGGSISDAVGEMMSEPVCRVYPDGVGTDTFRMTYRRVQPS